MLNIEKLPTEIQEEIWKLGMIITESESDRIVDEKYHRKCMCANGYCYYQLHMKRYELGITKNKPEPYYYKKK